MLYNWSLISGLVLASISFNWLPLTLACIILIGSRQHALFVLVHEAAHFHISRIKFLNNWFSDLLCAFPLGFDTAIYRDNHLKHHRHLNTDKDPDWIRKNGRPDWTFPTTPKKLALFLPYYVFYKGPIEWAVILFRFSGLCSVQRWKSQPLFLSSKVVYYSAIGFGIVHLQILTPFLLYWVVPTFFVLPVVGRIRSVAEHFAVTYQNELTSSREIHTNPIERFVFAPFNVHYHLSHHLYPQVPFYNLRALHQRLVESGKLDGAAMSSSYVFPFKNSLLSQLLKPVRPNTTGELNNEQPPTTNIAV